MAKLSDFPAPDAEPEVAQPNWECAPCGVTRDSDALTRANFDALCDRFDKVDPYGDHWEICCFPHFGVGWIEEIFVDPASKLMGLIPQTRKDMAEYPCLDDDLWFEYESAAAK